MQDIFNLNVTIFQSNCGKGLHFSAFHYIFSNYFKVVCYDKMCISNIKFEMYDKM